VFLYVSRLADVTFYYLHIPLVLSILALFIAFVSGAWVVSVKNFIGAMFGAMTAWLVVGVPFSIWPGGSADIIVNNWLRVVLAALLIIGLTVTFKEVTYLMNTIAVGVLFAAILGLRHGVSNAEGRLVVGGSGRLNNPNELAFVLLLGIPFWWRFMTSGKTGPFRKAAAVLALLTILLGFFKTGSRAGLFAFFIMMVAAFFRASMAGRLKLVVGGFLAFAIGFAALPQYLRQRYITFEQADFESIDTSVGEKSVGAAADSAQGRKANLIDSIRITIHNPLLGVGAGNFAIAQDNAAKAAGRRRGSWLGTHNTYTQLSSEAGIPVLLMFLTLLVTSILWLRDTRKKAHRCRGALAEDILLATAATEILAWAAFVFIFFAHVGYDLTIYLIVSLTFILNRAATRELQPQKPLAGPRRAPAQRRFSTPLVSVR
jgi:O-antigen ligase